MKNDNDGDNDATSIPYANLDINNADNVNRYCYHYALLCDPRDKLSGNPPFKLCRYANFHLLLKSFVLFVLILLFLLLINLSTVLCLDNNNADNDRNQRGRISDFRKRLPTAIIIGVKKGGTRALLEYLRLHPSIKAPGPEIHFFDKRYHFGVDWYRDQMVHTHPWQITLEKTPSYFVTKEAPARVYDMNPNIKLIIVVRNPVTRALSDYTQNASKRPGMPSFEEMAFTNLSHGLVNTSWGAIKIGLYHKHVKRWLKYFPRRQMHFVDGERLITSPANETNFVEEFLQVPKFIETRHFYVNSTRRLPCLTGAHGRGPPRCLGKTKGRQHPVVSPFHYERLRTFYDSHNEKFFKIIGQTFDW